MYRLIYDILGRLKATHQLSKRTRRLLTSLESRKEDGVGVYRVLRKLQKMIDWLDKRAGNAGADSLRGDYVDMADRIISRSTGNEGPRVQAIRSPAVLSVTVRQLLRRSALDVQCLGLYASQNEAWSITDMISVAFTVTHSCLLPTFQVGK